MTRKLYFGGNIITMEPGPQPEAILVEDGIIRQAGRKASLSSAGVELVNLSGRTLLPGFIDPHSHITALAQTLRLVDLSGTGSFQELEERISRYLREHPLKPGEWAIGFGYDHNAFDEKRHPDRTVLDRISDSVPILITHASGHMGVANTPGLRALGIADTTPDPSGGRLGRTEDGRTPNGYLEENAFFLYSTKTPPPSLESQLEALDAAQQTYFSYGITTAQDGRVQQAELSLLSAMAERNRLKLDVVGFLDLEQYRGLPDEAKPYLKEYRRHLKIGGYKIFLDGSPQGRTAWLSRPYENSDDCGYPKHSDAETADLVRIAEADQMQLLAHCNGDAAAGQYLNAYTSVTPKTALRPVMIHAQLVRSDQLKRMAALGMIPSFFIAHTYHWGDIHLKNLGPDRAGRISPAGEAVQLGLPYTLHQDTPVIRPDMLETVWCAVNRLTRSGSQLGRELRLTPLEALKGVTVNAAYQYFEEEQKGTIRAGKAADLVILDRNPLEVPPEQLRDIKVLETIKAGETVYRG